jgi:hypothetical protein
MSQKLPPSYINAVIRHFGVVSGDLLMLVSLIRAGAPVPLSLLEQAEADLRKTDSILKGESDAETA